MEPDFRPYVARLLIDWQASCPDASFRAIEGTLAFVDMSGFTKMSERLARHGKVGAEEVTDMINVIFTRLLGIAWQDGGGLLKFGGDALLLFFEGPGHALKACHAATAMRQALREFSRTTTSAGLVSLRMSVGIHSGSFDFFLVGERHRELVVTGPAATETVEMESTAVAGEIVVSAATASFLDPVCLGEAKGAGLLLRRVPSVSWNDSEHGADLAAPDLTPFIPLAIRKRISAGADHGEHRQVTTAFIHFGGINALMASEGPEGVRSRLHRMMTVVQEQAVEFDLCFLGTDIDRDGGKVILTAGAPESFENDEERTLRGVRAIIEGDYGLPLRIGINRGRVFAGEIGPTFRRTYTIMGDAVNVAARLMQAARAGQIVTVRSVLDRSRALFETKPLGPIFVKGKTQPVEAYELGSVSAPRREVATRRLPLLGRDAELSTLLTAAQRAGRGRGEVVELVAEPGMGKSRLIEELKARASGVTFSTFTCEQYEAATPYYPFAAVLRSLAGIRPELGPQESEAALRRHVRSLDLDVEPWLPLLALPMGVPTPETEATSQMDATFRKAGVHRTVHRFLQIALNGPSALVFEDVHWMDDASSDLLRYLAGAVPSQPWLLCVTRRLQATGFVPDEELERTTVRLDALSPSAAMDLTQAAFAEAALPAHIMAALSQRTGGNPLFLQQLVAASAADADILPDTIEAAIAGRLDRLPAKDRDMLRYASVVGPSFSLDVLDQGLSSEMPEIARHAPWQRLSEFVEEEAPGAFRFRHSLYQEVAYEGLSYRQRRRLHGQVGGVLETRAGAHPDELAGLLSLHFHRAQDYEKAWRYALTAGDRARSKFANVEAAKFYRRALDASKRVDGVTRAEVSTVWEALGDVSELTGLYGEAAAAYRSGRQAASQSGKSTTPFLLKEGVVRDALGLYTQALRWYGRGLRSLANDKDTKAARQQGVRLSLAVAAARFRQARHDECIRWCERAAAAAPAAGDRAGLARAYYLLDASYTDLGRPESARYRALALPIYEELGDLVGQSRVLNNLGIDAYYEGRWAEAMDLYKRSKEASEKAGDVVVGAIATNNIAEILSDQGRLDEGEPLFRDALRTWRAAGYSVGMALATSNLGRLASRAGRFGEADALLREAMESFVKMGAENFVLEARARIAEALIRQQRYEEASRELKSLVEQAASGGTVVCQVMVLRLQGEVLAEAGQHPGALACFQESVRLGRSVQADFEVALTLEAMLEHAQHQRAAPGPDATEASRIFERLGIARGRRVSPPAAHAALAASARSGPRTEGSPIK